MGVVVRGAGAAACALLESRFGAFVSASGDERLAITVLAGGGGIQLASGDGASGEPVRVAGDGYTASIDLGAGEAAVTGPAVADAVEAMMRLALPHLLLDGLLVHAALLTDGSRGFLCVGPSGCGKTTLARLLSGRSMGDELAIVRESGERWSVGSFPTPSARPGTVPLARIFFLRHAPAGERRPVSAAQAARRLAEQTHWPTEDPLAARRSFDLLARLAASVPAYDLGFALDPAVWQLIACAE